MAKVFYNDVFWPQASWFCVGSRVAFVALLSLEVILSARICAAC